jgi:hypothetical protein
MFRCISSIQVVDPQHRFGADAEGTSLCLEGLTSSFYNDGVVARAQARTALHRLSGVSGSEGWEGGISRCNRASRTSAIVAVVTETLRTRNANIDHMSKFVLLIKFVAVGRNYSAPICERKNPVPEPEPFMSMQSSKRVILLSSRRNVSTILRQNDIWF